MIIKNTFCLFYSGIGENYLSGQLNAILWASSNLCCAIHHEFRLRAVYRVNITRRKTEYNKPKQQLMGSRVTFYRTPPRTVLRSTMIDRFRKGYTKRHTNGHTRRPGWPTRRAFRWTNAICTNPDSGRTRPKSRVQQNIHPATRDDSIRTHRSRLGHYRCTIEEVSANKLFDFFVQLLFFTSRSSIFLHRIDPTQCFVASKLINFFLILEL